MFPRSRALVVLTLALALAGAASGAAAAAAASPAPPWTMTPADTITIDPAAVTVVPGGEQFSVTADSTTPLTSMTAQLDDAATGAGTLNLTMWPPPGGAVAGTSTWTSPAITTAALPLGTYDITVDAADQGGTTVTGQPAGMFAFQEVPSVTLSADNPVVSYGHQHPTVSGIVTVLLPGAKTAIPYAHQRIVLDDSSLGRVAVTTYASGRYVHTFLSPRAGETVDAEVPAAAAVAAAQSATVTFRTQTDPVKMSARLSATTVTYGGKVTVKGTVSYKPGSKYVPFPRQTVRIYDRAGRGSPVARAVTDARGNFTAALPREPASVHWVVQAGGPAAGPYLGTATSTLPMKVSLPTVVTGFHATLSPLWQVSFHGCLGLPPRIPGHVPSLTGLTIQYAARPRGPWHTLGTVAPKAGPACGNGGRTFGGTLPARLNYAYYRAVYAGGTDHAGTGYLRAASGPVLAWKYEDRIISLHVSKRTVAKGGKLTVSGRLQYYSAKWRNYPGQQVLVILRPQGSGTWYWIAIARTNPAGQFSATFADPVSATWSAEYLGDSAHLATAGSMIYVAVTQ